MMIYDNADYTNYLLFILLNAALNDYVLTNNSWMFYTDTVTWLFYIGKFIGNITAQIVYLFTCAHDI